MQGQLGKLIEAFAQPGRVTWIGLRPKRRASMHVVQHALVDASGLRGDHATSQKRAVTLVQAEHLAVIGAMLGRDPVASIDLRRNIVVSGLNLSALRGRDLQVGTAHLEITGPCAPCSRMEEALGTGGYSAMRGHGGWCARVLIPGEVGVGDTILPLTTSAPNLSKSPQQNQ